MSASNPKERGIIERYDTLNRSPQNIVSSRNLLAQFNQANSPVVADEQKGNSGSVLAQVQNEYTNKEKANATPYSKNSIMLDKLLTKPLTPEEEARRGRAASQVNAIGHLGSLLTAYANMAGVAKGATPTAAGYQGPELQPWRDKVQDRQHRYTTMQDALTRADWEQRYKERALQDAREQRAQAQSNTDKAYNLELAKFNAQQEQKAITNDQNQQKIDNTKSAQQAKNSILQEKNTIAASKQTGSQSSDTISAGGYNYIIDRKSAKEGTLSQIYNMIPDEYRNSLPSTDRILPMESIDAINVKRWNIIGRYATENPEWMESVRRKFPHCISRLSNEEKETFGPESKDPDPFK